MPWGTSPSRCSPVIRTGKRDRWFVRATARAAIRRFPDVAELVDALGAALNVELPLSGGAARAATASGRPRAAGRTLGRWRARGPSIALAGAALVAVFMLAPRPKRGPSAPARSSPVPVPTLAAQAPEPALPAASSTPGVTEAAPAPVRTRPRSRPKIDRPRALAAAAPIPSAEACEASAVAAGTAPAAAGTRVAIWDGDGAGAAAQGWDGCDKSLGCRSKIGLASEVGVNESHGLKFHGEGPGWLGFGWNVFGWFPANAGLDLTPYSHLTFQIRVEARSPDEAPDPGSLSVGLAASANQSDSASVIVERYAKGFSDGKWHEVAIPIAQFVKGGAGAKFDLGSFWELRLSTWSATSRRFDIYIDDIAVEQRCASRTLGLGAGGHAGVPARARS